DVTPDPPPAPVRASTPPPLPPAAVPVAANAADPLSVDGFNPTPALDPRPFDPAAMPQGETPLPPPVHMAAPPPSTAAAPLSPGGPSIHQPPVPAVN
ncbi:MAG: hypothetical protein QM690_17570, partial [Sphingobium sp.]